MLQRETGWTNWKLMDGDVEGLMFCRRGVHA